ncbi:MAG TPA: hypothetical protein VJR22_04645 [Candidatus Nitrosotalea sp.]|nr:hypothetical protein [Candidatus Nitrosotalea sp.]
MGESTKMSSTSFRKNLTLKIVVVALVALLFVPMFNAPSNAQVQNNCAAPLTTTIEEFYNGPIAVDAYWVNQGTSSANNSTSNNPVKKEVGPGEGIEEFAVVLVNRGNFPINSITGFLNLPAGFAPTGESKLPQLLQQYNPASKVASHYALSTFYGTVQPGGTFTLYFNVNVLDTAQVQTYNTQLVANYYILQSNQAGTYIEDCTSAILQIPLVLPGKVVLDVTSPDSNITPSQSDPITITIQNKGSAPATGVIATITNLGQKGNSGSGSSGTLTLSSTTTNIVNLGANQFNLGTIPAGGSANITTTVFPSSSAAGQTQDVSIGLSYENAWGASESTALNTGLVVSPIPPESLSLNYIGNTTSPVITSGNLANLNFAVSNNSTAEASNVVISLVPQSTSVSVVGQSTWTIPKLEPGQQQYLSTQVFAANSLIDTPTSFTLTANYVANGQTETNSLTLGAFVVGDIKLQIYGLAISTVGNSPQIAGSLLNQGSTTGLYGTIQLAPSPLLDAIRQARMANGNGSNYTSSLPQADAQSSFGQGGQGGGFGGGQGGRGSGGGAGGRGMASTQQFLGDLTADSPIPFSIPIYGLNLLPPGSYPVSFKVVYADDLKNIHTVTLTQNVMVARSTSTHVKTQTSIIDEILGNTTLQLAIGVSIAGAIAAVIIIRKRKSRKKLKMLTGNDTDIVTVLKDTDKKQNESK